MNPEILEMFCQAVSDIGVFSWWSVSDDGKFQVEFAGTQLWMPPLTPEEPPCGTIALCFEGQVSYCFLRKDNKRLPLDWADQLARDEIRPLPMTPQRMKLYYQSGTESFLAEVHRHLDLGTAPGPDDLLACPIRLTFWAGEVGVAVASRRVSLVSHQGTLDWQLIPGMVSRWWSYWENYWEVRQTPGARTWDYACEATVPVLDES